MNYMGYSGTAAVLRDLSQRHSDLAAAYAEADDDDGTLERIYSRLRDLEQSIAAELADLFYELADLFYELADLFYELEHPMPKLRDLMSRPTPFKED